MEDLVVQQNLVEVRTSQHEDPQDYFCFDDDAQPVVLGLILPLCSLLLVEKCFCLSVFPRAVTSVEIVNGT